MGESKRSFCFFSPSHRSPRSRYSVATSTPSRFLAHSLLLPIALCAKKTIRKASGGGRKIEGIQFVHADLLLCQEGHVYIVDYKELEGINTTGESTYAAEPLGLFYVKASGDLVPIAIQLLQQPSDTNPIWTPADSQYDWLLAKMWLRNADHRVQQVLCNFNFLKEKQSVNNIFIESLESRQIGHDGQTYETF